MKPPKYIALAITALALSSCGSTVFLDDGKVTIIPPKEPIVIPIPSSK